jgi:uncharacterized membrane protein (UPF0136 family)
MKPKLGNWMIGYGVFLIAMGAAGYLSNPSKAATALISGGTFGGLSMLWGWLMSRGVGWSRWAAVATTALLVAVFGWRASVSWGAVADGVEGKLTAALLITTMGLGSLIMLTLLLRDVCGRARTLAGASAKP